MMALPLLQAVALLLSPVEAWSARPFSGGAMAGSRPLPPRCLPVSTYRPDPAYQRDAIVLLWGIGWQVLIRAASTGVKDRLGFDAPMLVASAGGALAVAITWLLAAELVGVLADDERRYNNGQLLFAWAIAAPCAFALRSSLDVALFGTVECWEPSLLGRFGPQALAVDALLTLLLMYAVRKCEESELM
mmetsp:Transcript_11559/g.27704  ORF Transcript_11559/g.27704 Transcript_11559/m.27704 type:complete len:189 (-) Transcript_11559:85-651(-)